MGATHGKAVRKLFKANADYQIFILTHWLWVAFVALMVLHGVRYGNPVTRVLMLPPVLLLALHYYLAEVRSVHKTVLT